MFCTKKILDKDWLGGNLTNGLPPNTWNLFVNIHITKRKTVYSTKKKQLLNNKHFLSTY